MTSVAMILAALVMGFASSVHCSLMCGPICGVLDQQTTTLSATKRRIAYQVGRLGYYLALVSVIVLIGNSLSPDAGTSVVSKIARAIAAVVLLTIGLQMISGRRLFRWLEKPGHRLWAALNPMLRHLFPLNNMGKVIAAGFVWGTIPCGILYAAVAAASATLSLPLALGMITAFWLGTLPALVTISAGVGLRRTPRFRQAAGVAVVMLAVSSLWSALPSVNVMDHDQHSMSQHRH